MLKKSPDQGSSGRKAKKKPVLPEQRSGKTGFLFIKLVEAAGVEPASANIPLRRLHTYPGI
jgi:hypothetical protein